MSRISKFVLGFILLLGSIPMLQSKTVHAAEYVVAPQIATGYYHSLSLTTDGRVWGWGQNTMGQLGNGSTGGRSAPVEVANLDHVKSIATGNRSSYAIKEDGTLWAWGMNENGQLGDGSTENRKLPVQITGITGGVKAISTGIGYHTLAIDNDGNVWAWGTNNSGELGDGTTIQRNSPVQVSGLSDVVAVAAGGWHSLAVKSDGTVWTWGNNQYGELGDGTKVARSTPQQIGISGVKSVGAGNNHSLAVKNDGTVWSWGRNYWGMLGDSSGYDRLTPVQASLVSDVKAVVGGGNHSYAVTNGGKVWAWGVNAQGQIGDGTWEWRYTPVEITALSDIESLGAGGFNGIAMQTDGTVWGWGLNSSGELGDGTTEERRVPVVNKAVLDLTPPTVADSVIVATGLSHEAVTLSWTKATDNLSKQSELEYRVYKIAGSNTGTVGAVESGTPLGSYQADVSTKQITGLYGGQTYYYAVIAKDKVGQKSVYQKIRVRTLDEPTYVVFYEGNGNTRGEPPIDPFEYWVGEWATVLENRGNLERSGFAFEGWNTRANGSGDTYLPGETIEMPAADVTLFARWRALPDMAAPLAIDYSPASNAADVPANAPLSIKFNELVTAVTGKMITVSRTDGSWQETLSVTDASKVAVAGDKVSLLLSVPLQLSAEYAIRIDPGAFVDGAGNAYAGISDDTTWTFATQAEPVDPPGDDATLASMSLSAANGDSVPLSPAFSRDETYYSVSVTNSVSSVSVTAATYDAKASVTASVYGNSGLLTSGPHEVTNGVPSESFPLEIGNNRIELNVTAENGTSTKYVVEVARESASVDPGESGDSTLGSLVLWNGASVPFSPAFSRGQTAYEADVGYNVSSVSVTAATYDAKASVTASVYGKSGLLTSGPHRMTNGLPSAGLTLEEGNNRIELNVTAENGTSTKYVVEVKRGEGSGNGGGSNVDTVTDPKPPAAESNLKATVGGYSLSEVLTVRRTTSGTGRVKLTASIEAGSLLARLAREPDRSRLVIESDKSDTDVVLELTGKVVQEMAKKGSILEIRTPYGGYELPAAAIDLERLSRLFDGKSLDEAIIAISISQAEAKRAGNVLVVGTPVGFAVTVSYGGITKEADHFGVFVERYLPLPSGIRPNEISTAVVLEEDGSVRHVPTRIEERYGKPVAVANSLTNSVYALVRYSGAFSDVDNHWAKKEANDLASRLILKGSGDGRFLPATSVTRAEFVAMLVRALGISDQGGDSGYADVVPGAWYAGAAAQAARFGIAEGDATGNFRPSATISREEAAVMLARAMDLTGLTQDKETSEASAAITLAKFGDAADVSGWARQSVALNVEEGLLKGNRSSALLPKNTLTRAETAVIVSRLLRRSGLID